MIRTRITAILILLIFTGIFGGCGGNNAALQPISNQDSSSDIPSPSGNGVDDIQPGDDPTGDNGDITAKGVSFKWEEGDPASGTAKSCIEYDKNYPGVERARASVGGAVVEACTADIYAGYVGKCAFVEDKEYQNTIFYYSNYTAAVARGICTALKGTWVSAE